MATPNGYLSDCGAPGSKPRNYEFTRPNYDGDGSGNDDSSHLSFLYDRAQGNGYDQQDGGGITTHFPSGCSPQVNGTDHQTAHCSTSLAIDLCSDIGASRATPAPANPYGAPRALYTTIPKSAESLACPTGSYTNNHSPVTPSHCGVSGPRPVTVDHAWKEHRSPSDSLDRQLMNLRVTDSGPSGPVSPSSEVIQGHPKSMSSRNDACPTRPGSQTVDRAVHRPVGQYAFHSPSTMDPRKNYIRKNIPMSAKDINAARKFSMPMLNRPRFQVADYSSDDQMTNPDLPKPEIDKSSVRHLLREGDEIKDYAQESIRYTGRTNPSKAFRLLQSATGSSDSESIEQHLNERRQKRRQKREEILSASAAEEKEVLKDSDDVVDISYVGSNIPSRTFRFLQEAIGARDQQAGVTSPTPDVEEFGCTGFQADQPPPRSVKVIRLRPQRSLENLIGDF